MATPSETTREGLTDLGDAVELVHVGRGVRCRAWTTLRSVRRAPRTRCSSVGSTSVQRVGSRWPTCATRSPPRGYDAVRTLLASGNVVVRSSRSAEDLADDLEQVIEERFGSHVPVVVRTKQELAEVVALDPLKEVATDPARYVVTFFDRPVPADALEVLAGVDLREDRFETHGREMYAWTPDGVSRSQASDVLAKHGSRTKAARAARVSGRNWNTVVKVLAALRAAHETQGPSRNVSGAVEAGHSPRP